jgi:conjugative transfer signal peptidase TraF
MTPAVKRILFFYGGFVVVIVVINTMGYGMINNTTDSLPPGLYFISPAQRFSVGDLVVLSVPARARTIYRGRSWLPPENVALIKRVVAVAGDQVCLINNQLTINKQLIGFTDTSDLQGEALFPVEICETIRAGELYLANVEHSNSFDSRYFGPVPVTDIEGAASTFWVW